MLAGGNILRRDEILYGCTLKEARPFIDWRIREVLFRESVIAFLGVDTPRGQKKKARDKYCAACRKAKKGKQDCSKCSRTIEVNDVG